MKEFKTEVITYPEEFIIWLYKKGHPFVLQKKGWINIDDFKLNAKHKYYNLKDIYNYWVQTKD